MKFLTRELCPGSQLARILSVFGPYLNCLWTNITNNKKIKKKKRKRQDKD